MSSIPDEIRKETVLAVPIAKVWSAISDSKQFGTWFGAEVAGPFVAGARVKARIKPTQVDEAVAEAQQAHAGVEFYLDVEQVDAPHRLSFRWAPGSAPDPADPTTLVTFELEPRGDKETQLVITESGFSKIPLERRARAFADNDGGWTAQVMLVTKYLLPAKAA